MKPITKRPLVALVACIGMTAATTVVSESAAFAISSVSCGPSDYVLVETHPALLGRRTDCYANAGTIWFGGENWVHKISTGNNVVQWYGDGRWQPDPPTSVIGKWTVMTWPSFPGGVDIEGIRIL